MWTLRRRLESGLSRGDRDLEFARVEFVISSSGDQGSSDGDRGGPPSATSAGRSAVVTGGEREREQER
ncbi:hypothetical protein [Halobiforma nitratireducens]|uniref:hypothetical protein n=1 Tax=Halobiforma nitratireducens TaxID=130048 RepID=UPI00135F11F3